MTAALVLAGVVPVMGLPVHAPGLDAAGLERALVRAVERSPAHRPLTLHTEEREALALPDGCRVQLACALERAGAASGLVLDLRVRRRGRGALLELHLIRDGVVVARLSELVPREAIGARAGKGVALVLAGAARVAPGGP